MKYSYESGERPLAGGSRSQAHKGINSMPFVTPGSTPIILAGGAYLLNLLLATRDLVGARHHGCH